MPCRQCFTVLSLVLVLVGVSLCAPPSVPTLPFTMLGKLQPLTAYVNGLTFHGDYLYYKINYNQLWVSSFNDTTMNVTEPILLSTIGRTCIGGQYDNTYDGNIKANTYRNGTNYFIMPKIPTCYQNNPINRYTAPYQTNQTNQVSTFYLTDPPTNSLFMTVLYDEDVDRYYSLTSNGAINIHQKVNSQYFTRSANFTPIAGWFPNDIHIGCNKELWVVETQKNRITSWNPINNYTTWDTTPMVIIGQNDTTSTSTSVLNYPMGLAFNSDCSHMYVFDSQAIYQFTYPYSTGMLPDLQLRAMDLFESGYLPEHQGGGVTFGTGNQYPNALALDPVRNILYFTYVLTRNTYSSSIMFGTINTTCSGTVCPSISSTRSAAATISSTRSPSVTPGVPASSIAPSLTASQTSSPSISTPPTTGVVTCSISSGADECLAEDQDVVVGNNTLSFAKPRLIVSGAIIFSDRSKVVLAEKQTFSAQNVTFAGTLVVSLSRSESKKRVYSTILEQNVSVCSYENYSGRFSNIQIDDLSVGTGGGDCGKNIKTSYTRNQLTVLVSDVTECDSTTNGGGSGGIPKGALIGAVIGAFVCAVVIVIVIVVIALVAGIITKKKHGTSFSL